MNRLVELSNNNNRTEKEELEFVYMQRKETLHGLMDMARRMGNKHPEKNFLIVDAMEKYEEAKTAYENYCKAN